MKDSEGLVLQWVTSWGTGWPSASVSCSKH